MTTISTDLNTKTSTIVLQSVVSSVGMKEVLQVQVGQFGNQAGALYWDTLYRDLGLHLETERTLHDRTSVFFTEERETSGSVRYRPRSVLVDLEPGVVERVVRSTFRPENCVTSQCGAANNWARAYHGAGAEVMVRVEDVVRREVERSDLLQGFQLCHSVGGGTGSGLGSLLAESVSDQYPGRMIHTTSLLPSNTVTTSLLEPYNAGLNLRHLLHHSHVVVCGDNGALSNICSRHLHISRPSYSHLNSLLARMMTDLSLLTDLRKMAVSLVPRPRLHFLVPSLAPVTSLQGEQVEAMALIREMFDGGTVLADCDLRRGRFLTVSTVVRGGMSVMELGQHISHLVDRRSQDFVPWIPDNVIINTHQAEELSGTMVGNSTAIVQPLRSISSTFRQMFRRRAFLHYYTAEGTEEAEFVEALSEMDSLVLEYEVSQEITDDVGEISEEDADDISEISEKLAEDLSKFSQDDSDDVSE